MRRFLFSFFALFMVGCGGGSGSHPAVPYVNRFLLNLDTEGECITATIKVPEDYVGYLTVNDDPEAGVFRFIDEIDGRRHLVEGTPVSIATVALCGVNLDDVNELTLELIYEPQSAPAPNVFGILPKTPFGVKLTEYDAIFVASIPPPEPGTPLVEITTEFTDVTFSVEGIICETNITVNGAVVASFLADGESTDPFSPGSWTFLVEDCNGFVKEVTLLLKNRPEGDPCLPDLNFLSTGGTTDVRTNRLQWVVDSLHFGGKSRIDVKTDYITDELDTAWAINTPDGFGPVEGDAAALIVIELAGFRYHNLFGIYAADDSDNRVVLFDGPDGTTDSVTLAFLDDGTVLLNGESAGEGFDGARFGFFLDSSYFAPSGGIFFSDSSLNPGKQDYMVAYQGDNDVIINPPGDWPAEVFRSDEFILGFEDLYNEPPEEGNEEIAQTYVEGFSSDFDYEDMVVLISGVRPNLCNPSD